MTTWFTGMLIVVGIGVLLVIALAAVGVYRNGGEG